MTPSQTGDLIRSVTAFIQGGVMVAWLFILFKARDLEHGIRLRHWAIRFVAGLLLLFTYLTIEDVVDRQGQPPGTPLLFVLIYLATVTGFTGFVVRDLRADYREKATGKGEEGAGEKGAGGHGGEGGTGGQGGPGPGGGTGGVGGQGGQGGRGAGDQPGQPGEPGKPGT